MNTTQPPQDQGLDQRIQALERGFKLLVEATKLERLVYLVTNVIVLVTILGLLVYVIGFRPDPDPQSNIRYVEIFIGGGGGGVIALITWRIMRIWDDYFRTLRELLQQERQPPKRGPRAQKGSAS